MSRACPIDSDGEEEKDDETNISSATEAQPAEVVCTAPPPAAIASSLDRNHSSPTIFVGSDDKDGDVIVDTDKWMKKRMVSTSMTEIVRAYMTPRTQAATFGQEFVFGKK